MKVACHVCGLREPVNPSVRFPICSACKRSVWERGQHDPEHLKQLQECATANLLASVIALRRIKAARDGIGSLLPISPVLATPPKT